MKKISTFLLLSVLTTPLFAAKLDLKTQEEAYKTISSLEHLSALDASETRSFLAKSDEKEVAKYLADLTYKNQKNNNELAFKNSLEQKSVTDLIAMNKK